MATNPRGVSTGAPDEKAQKLVRKIIARTTEGKINWQKLPGGLRASVAGKMEFFFSRTENLPGFASMGAREWSVFLVRDEAGKEILKVTPLMNVYSILAGADPLIQEVDTLFGIANGKASSELDKAMRVLDQL